MLVPVIVGLAIVTYQISEHTSFMPHGEDPPVPIAARLQAFPLAIFLVQLVRRACRRQWRSAAWLLVAAGVLAAVTASIAIVVDRVNHFSGPMADVPSQYSSSGWYFVLFAGAYFVGILILARAIFGPPVRFCWRRLRTLATRWNPSSL